MLEWLQRRKRFQVDLAIHLAVTEAYISRVIANKDQLSVYNMRKTAKFLNCHMDDLVEWTGELQ